MRKILINTVFKLDILVAPQIVRLTRPSRRNSFFVIYYFIHKHMLHYNPHDNTLRTLWFCSLTFPLTCTDRFLWFCDSSTYYRSSINIHSAPLLHRSVLLLFRYKIFFLSFFSLLSLCYQSFQINLIFLICFGALWIELVFHL